MAKHDTKGGIVGAGAKVNAKKDMASAVDQDAVTSKVEVVGTRTVRRYSDGAVQHNHWDSKRRAQEYAASVAEQEGK